MATSGKNDIPRWVYLLVCCNWCITGDTCGSNHQLQSGGSVIVTSPNYPNNYPNSKDCTWIIQAPAGHVIRISFNHFSIEHHDSCGYDDVSVYDGTSASPGQRRSKLCGDKSAFEITSTGKSALIKFHSDSSATKAGFNATCYAIGSCPDNFYGPNCEQTCGQCKTGTFCNKSSGACPDGCKNGFQIPMCKECVDGRYGTTCTESCGHCKNGTVCVKQFGSCPDGCEDRWQGPTCKDCLDGRYGTDCENTCGHCATGGICDKRHGTCSGGCDPGWKRPLCQTECENGLYGINCTEECGQCKQGTFCNKFSGNCPLGCDSGWQGDKCDSGCINGRYGRNCNSTCGRCKLASSCDKKNGRCLEGCKDGWGGEYCVACENGIYGQHCNLSCGSCKPGSFCDKQSGRCPDGCDLGWRDELCDAVCDDGRFGYDCNLFCGSCSAKSPCNKTSGFCPNGCQAGWEGDLCAQAISQGSGADTSIPIIASCVTLAILLVIVIIIVIFVRRRQKRKALRKDFGRDADNVYIEGNPLYSNSDIKSTDDEKNQIYENVDPRNLAMMSDLAASNSNVTKESDKQNLATTLTSEDERQKAETEESDNGTEDEESIPSATQKGDINVYYNHIPPNIVINDLKKYIDDRVSGVGFADEFKVLPTDMCKPHDVGKEPRNKIRNRFAKLYAYDHSRVKLEDKAENESDYINASYIGGYTDSKSFIATQGPAVATIPDFWAMVWQENTRQIIMLTNLFEAGKKKCEKYWPDHGQTETYGTVRVTCRHCTERANYTVRKLTLQNTVSGKNRYVTHFHFTTWPDHGVPSSPALVSFWKEIKKEGQQKTAPIVHCSAGIGRTGAFVALDNLMDQVEAEGKLNIFLCIAKLREDRVNMVQTVAQYVFVHHVVLEAVESRNTMLTAVQFEAVIDSGLSTTVEHEYKALQELKSNGDKVNQQGHLSAGTKASNTLPVGVPKFTFLPSLKYKKGFILTESPTESTAEEYWQLFQAHDVLTVVSINPQSTGPERSENYLPKQSGDEIHAGTFHIKLESRGQISDDLTQTTLTISNEEYEPSKVMSIEMFTLNIWDTEDDMQRNKYSLLLLLDALEKREHETDYHPIIIHSLGGASQAGLFCAVSNVVSKLKQDRDIDVFLTVRELQCINPQFLNSLSQYHFCYEVAKEYLSSMDMYANV